MTNQERAVEVTKTHDLFHFTSGDGWMEPYEDVIRCACGEEFFSYIQTGDGSYDDDRDPDLLYRQHLTQALADAGLLMPEPTESSWPNGIPTNDDSMSSLYTSGGKVYACINAGYDSANEELTPDEAIAWGYDLIAAARQAQQEQ